MLKTIDLKVNGRLFPLWILKNFKKYKLPDIIRKKGEDPCEKNEKQKLINELTTYQKFIGQFLNYRSPFKDILLYHGMGSGKTVSAINVYNILYNYTPKWNIFILIPASLHNEPWLKDLNKWIKHTDKTQRMSNIHFIHYDSPFADRVFLETIKKTDSSKHSLYIFDEAHNFIRNVYNNISSKKGKRAQVIYDYIQQEKKENNDTRIMLLSATPAVNTPYEFALIFNLMRPNSFPTSESIFNQIYISSTNFKSLNENKKNLFQRRIMGLTSYYIGATPDKYATKTVHYKNIEMQEYQEEIYNHFEKIEEEREKLRRQFSRGKVGDDMSTFASYTRSACNFVFPHINEEVNGEKRPRPGQFRIKDEEGELIDEGKDIEPKTALLKKKEQTQKYIKASKKYINTLIEYLKDIYRKDKKNNHTLYTDIKNFFKFNGSFNKLITNNKKSRLLKTLYTLSPKMVIITFNILKSKGPVLFYSNYVNMEGLQIFKIFLQFFGFIDFNDDKKYKKNEKDKYRYVEFHGAIDKNIRENNRIQFNKKENMYGKKIKIIMISPAGAEGINLRNVRQVHIMEPYWNEVRIEQVIGRAIRQCYHEDLPMDERTVDVYRYKMIRKNGKETTDEVMEKIARRKNNLLLSFTEAVKEVAVDCELFQAHNMMGTKYKCFKFNEDSLFENPIGPAYDYKLDFDKKIDNGSNSKDAIMKKIKVRKIKAVEQLDNNIFSEPKNYWYNDKTGMIYDIDLNYPIGRINKDENNNPEKLDSDIYIISLLINIPDFKLYD